MKCLYCGYDMPDAAKFCRKCGYPANWKLEERKQNQTDKIVDRSWKKALIVGAIAGIAAIIIVGVIVADRISNEGSETAGSQTGAFSACPVDSTFDEVLTSSTEIVSTYAKDDRNPLDIPLTDYLKMRVSEVKEIWVDDYPYTDSWEDGGFTYCWFGKDSSDYVRYPNFGVSTSAHTYYPDDNTRIITVQVTPSQTSNVYDVCEGLQTDMTLPELLASGYEVDVFYPKDHGLDNNIIVDATIYLSNTIVITYQWYEMIYDQNFNLIQSNPQTDPPDIVSVFG